MASQTTDFSFPGSPLAPGGGRRFRSSPPLERTLMTLGTILLIVLVLMLLGALPTWPHSRNWGYYPSGGLGLVLIILVVLMLTKRI